MPIIELNELSKWYGEVIGLNNVTAAIGSGITGLLGPNGAGKTTLMGLAMGQLRPSDGSIRVLGERIWDNPAVLSRIGYCPEGDIFWPKLTGLEFVSFLARSSGLRGRAAKTATLRAIEQTGMTESMNRAIRGYSKGMRQRIKISQALAPSPPLLILDEPFTGAHPVARHAVGDRFPGVAPGVGDEDGVTLNVDADDAWPGFADLVCDEDLRQPKFARLDARWAEHDLIDEKIARWTRVRERDVVVDQLLEEQVIPGMPSAC